MSVYNQVRSSFVENLLPTVVEIDSKEPNTRVISASCQGRFDDFVVTILKFPDFGFNVWNA